MDYLCEMLYYLQLKHNMWATRLRSKLKKAFENFDSLRGRNVSWFIDQLEKKREELTTVGVYKTDQDMADLLRTAAKNDERYQLVVHSLVSRVGEWTYEDLKNRILAEEYDITEKNKQALQQNLKKKASERTMTTSLKRTCGNCGSTQHRAPECDQPKNPNPPCWKCEKPGHQSKECPEKQSNGTGQGGGAGGGVGGCSTGGGGAGRTQRVGIMMPAPRTEEKPDYIM